jgi:hypothetical protein
MMFWLMLDELTNGLEEMNDITIEFMRWHSFLFGDSFKYVRAFIRYNDIM